MTVNKPITLARGLKIRKRIESRLHRLMEDITKNNSILKGAIREVDVKASLKEHGRVSDMLSSLRVELWKESLPIQPKILQINELKGRIAMLSRLSTTHGLVEGTNWRTPDAPPVEYEATLRKSDVDEMVKAAETRIDELQDELDAHNAMTKITVELDI